MYNEIREIGKSSPKYKILLKNKRLAKHTEEKDGFIYLKFSLGEHIVNKEKKHFFITYKIPL